MAGWPPRPKAWTASASPPTSAPSSSRSRSSSPRGNGDRVTLLPPGADAPVTPRMGGLEQPPHTALLAAGTLERARDHLLGLQHPGGWWQGELETNVTMDAEDLLLRHFLGILTPELATESAGWIRSKQREDGTWANFYGGPGDLSTTVEAYVALRLAGDTPDEPHMRKAADRITARGGLAATRVFTRIWLALSGLWSWDELPVIPPEIIYLPSWFPLNIYDWGCWARQTVVALAVVASFKPARALPFAIGELYAKVPGLPRKAGQNDPWSLFFNALDKALHKVEHRIPKRARRAALRRCADWIIARQEADGCWGGIQPPWVYSIMGLHLLGFGLDHPVIAKAIAGLERFTIRENGTRRLEACQSPVWDTVLTMTALADAGLPPEHPALVSAANWVLAEEIRQPGDRQGPALAGRHAVQGRRLGRVRRGQHPRADQQAAVLRLRRGHRPAERGRHRAHRGGVRRRGPGRRDGLPPRRGLAAEEPGGGRVLVRPLGRELRLRHRRGRAGADRGRGQARQAADPPRRCLAACTPEPRRRLGRGPALLRRPGGLVGYRRLDRLADRVGTARAARGRRARVADP